MTVRDKAQAIHANIAPRISIFLTVTVPPGRENDVRETLSEVAGIVRSTGFRVPEADLSCIVGIGALLWDRMYEAPRPALLHPFEPVRGENHEAPATPGDLLFHIRSQHMDSAFELARLLREAFGDAIVPEDEVVGFRYWDQRDLLGFVDGSENPTLPVIRDPAVYIDEQEPRYAGGSYVIVQKYLHDMAAWDALSVEEQERVIGRRKMSNMELGEDEKPSNSHVALNDIDDEDGNPRKIVRDNMPFGSVASGEFGTYFIGYAADVTTTEQMLRNMFIGDPPGNHDRILDFSTAVTGCLFFVPPAQFLDDATPFEQDALAAGQSQTGADEG